VEAMWYQERFFSSDAQLPAYFVDDRYYGASRKRPKTGLSFSIGMASKLTLGFFNPCILEINE